MNDIVRLVLSEGESDSTSTNDNVNHPSHYETGNFECIDVMIETQGKGSRDGLLRVQCF